MTVELVGKHRGRKRKFVGFDPSGRTAEVRPDDKIRTSRQPHRRALPQDLRLSEKAESPIGRMLLRGQLEILAPNRDEKKEIAELRYEAGQRYAVLVGQFRSLLSGPKATSGSGRGSECAGSGGGICDPEECECLRKRAKFEAAEEALCEAGKHAARAVIRCAVNGQDLMPEESVYLVCGLDKLVAHFGLTTRRQRPHSKNTN